MDPTASAAPLRARVADPPDGSCGSGVEQAMAPVQPG
jgi:hypothetical protein